MPSSVTIIQTQASTSNYTNPITWYKGGVSQSTYNPQIGQHNTGGDGTGSICILPYPTTTSPWGGTVGLFIQKGSAKLDNNTLIHSGNISSQSVNYATSAGSASSVAWSNVSSKPSSYTPSSHNHDYDSYIGSKSKYTQKSARGSNPHHLIYGSDADYGVMKVQHTSDEGSGGPGAFTASLAIFDERANNLSGAYQPTFYINRSGATRTPDLLGIDVGGTRVLTVNSSGVTSGTFSGNLTGNASSASSVSWSNVTSKPTLCTNPMTSTLIITPGSESGFREGIRINNASNGWTTLALGGSATSGCSGTWSMHTYNGTFYLTKNGSSSGTNMLTGTDTSWTFQSSVYTGSDRRLKKNISIIPESSLDKLFDISDKLIRSFTWKDSGKKSYGFIAQQIEKYIPEAVSQMPNGTKSVSYDIVYSKIIASLIQEMKKMKSIIEHLNKDKNKRCKI